jgi:hypothetical protein
MNDSCNSRARCSKPHAPRFGRGPVVIGGVGGSGTRVAAEILSVAGYYIGADLNVSVDNLLFTLLFKRPRWLPRNRNGTQKIGAGLRVLEKLMLRSGRLSLREWNFLLGAVFSGMFFGTNHKSGGQPVWSVKRALKGLFPGNPGPLPFIGWGWKEPNSHLILPHMSEHFGDFKYIHTIRHGLDMAFSSNQQQLYNWAGLFGIDKPKSPEEVPLRSLQYWIEANQKVLEIGERLGADRFLLINFDLLCAAPEEGVKKIFDFLGIAPPREVVERAVAIPKAPKSTGRYRQQDLSRFNPELLGRVASLGFPIQTD